MPKIYVPYQKSCLKCHLAVGPCGEFSECVHLHDVFPESHTVMRTTSTGVAGAANAQADHEILA